MEYLDIVDYRLGSGASRLASGRGRRLAINGDNYSDSARSEEKRSYPVWTAYIHGISRRVLTPTRSFVNKYGLRMLCTSLSVRVIELMASLTQYYKISALLVTA